MRLLHYLFVLECLLLSGCESPDDRTTASRSVLRVAVTTSTRDSGLLEVLVPLFEHQSNARIDIIAVGTGAALKLAENGDVGVVLVHARSAEDAFMAAGHGIRREDVMYNTFEILGPVSDSAGIRKLAAAAALQKIASAGHRFVSRGDDSGTHKRELNLWNDGGGLPAWDDYVESGQGMGATLVMADQMNAYVLCDRGTYLKFKNKIALAPLIASSESLLNPYGVIAVDPAKNSEIDGPLCQAFIDFLISTEVQTMISDYTAEGEQLFHPLHFSDQSNQNEKQQ